MTLFRILTRSIPLFLIVSGVGCNRGISTSELAGVYVAKYPFGKDTVTVFPDGRFTQVVLVNAQGRQSITNGTWHFSAKNAEIVFSDEFMVAIDGFGKFVPTFDRPDHSAISIMPVRRRFGKLEIGGDDFLWGRGGAETPHKKQPATSSK